MSFSIESDPFDFDPDDESIISEPESLCNNWRGWKRSPVSGYGNNSRSGISATNFQLHNFLSSSAPQGINSGAFYDLIDTSRQHEILRRRENAGLVSAGLNVGLVNPKSIICNVDGPISVVPKRISTDLIHQSHRPNSPTVSVLKSIYQSKFFFKFLLPFSMFIFSTFGSFLFFFFFVSKHNIFIATFSIPSLSLNKVFFSIFFPFFFFLFS